MNEIYFGVLLLVASALPFRCADGHHVEVAIEGLQQLNLLLLVTQLNLGNTI